MRIFYFLFALALLCSLVSCGSDGKCRGLVFSGGGDRGAYEAGIVATFVEKLSAIDVQYDIIAGTSAGSLNVFGFGLEAVGNEKAGGQLLQTLWEGISKSEVYKDWPQGIAQGLFYEYGLYDTSPLHDKLINISKITGKCQRSWSMVSSNAVLAFPERFNETVGLSNEIITTLASSAVPVIFPHIQIGKYAYMDG